VLDFSYFLTMLGMLYSAMPADPPFRDKKPDKTYKLSDITSITAATSYSAPDDPHKATLEVYFIGTFAKDNSVDLFLLEISKGKSQVFKLNDSEDKLPAGFGKNGITVTPYTYKSARGEKIKTNLPDRSVSSSPERARIGGYGDDVTYDWIP
jgi:hypothetical protein